MSFVLRSLRAVKGSLSWVIDIYAYRRRVYAHFMSVAYYVFHAVDTTEY